MMNNGVCIMKEDKLSKWIKSKYEVIVIRQKLEYKKEDRGGTCPTPD